MLNMYQQITIKTLKKQGEKNTAIAGQIGCHRNTVRNILLREKLVAKQTRNKASYFDSFHDKIKELLDKKVTRLRIWEILTEEDGMQRAYDSLCKYIKKEFPQKPKAFGVQMVSPGEEAEADFGYCSLMPNNQGGLSKTWIFIMTLGSSRDSYYCFTNNQKLQTLMKAFKNAFAFFGGVPKKVKIDNMRAVILKNQHYDLQFNQDFLEFSHHYGFIIKPCAPYHPEQKGKVESGIKYFELNFLNGREFKDGVDKDRKLYSWMVNYANRRVHGTTKKIPAEEFERTEKQHLQPLPENEFSFFQRGVRKVKANCHINFKNNYYSVPAWLVGKPVTIRWNDHILRLIYKGEQVSLHRIARDKQGEYVTVRSHLPDYKCFSETEYQAKYEQKMAEVGPWAHQYFRKVLLKQDRHWFRTIRAILGLVKTYGEKQVDLALKRALSFGVINLAAIRNICEKRLYLFDEEPKLPKNNSAVGSPVARSLNYYQLTLKEAGLNQESKIYQLIKKLKGGF